MNRCRHLPRMLCDPNILYSLRQRDTRHGNMDKPRRTRSPSKPFSEGIPETRQGRHHLKVTSKEDGQRWGSLRAVISSLTPMLCVSISTRANHGSCDPRRTGERINKARYFISDFVLRHSFTSSNSSLDPQTASSLSRNCDIIKLLHLLLPTHHNLFSARKNKFMRSLNEWVNS